MGNKNNSRKGNSGKRNLNGKVRGAASNTETAKGKDDKKLEKTTTMIRYEFNDAELRLKAQQLAEANKRLGTLSGELTTIKKDYTKKITETQCQIDELSDNVTQKYEMRNTPCYLHKNFDMKERQYLDHSGSILKTEPLTPVDYQLAIDQEEEA